MMLTPLLIRLMSPSRQRRLTFFSKGLSFCPKPSKLDEFQLKKDLELFYDSEGTSDANINPFKNKSNWTPPSNRDPALETYITAVRRD